MTVFCAPSTRPRMASGVASTVRTPSTAEAGALVSPTSAAPARTSHGEAMLPTATNPTRVPVMPITNHVRRRTRPVVAA